MRTSHNKNNWKKDYEFYKNQHQYPRTLVMEGIDRKYAMLVARREERIKAEYERRAKNAAVPIASHQLDVSNICSSRPL